MGFWLNVGSVRVTLHLPSCPHAVPRPKTEGGWTAFASEEDAIASLNGRFTGVVTVSWSDGL